MAALSALRDLAAAQTLNEEYNKKKPRKHKLEKAIETVPNVMKCGVSILKEQKNKELSQDRFINKIKGQYGKIKSIYKLCHINFRQLLKLMIDKELIESRVSECGSMRIVKLCDFDDDELDERINKKDLNWYEIEENQEMIQNIFQFLKSNKFKNKEDEYQIKELNKAIKKQFKKKITKLFKLQKDKEFWDYLESKQMIKSNTSMDGELTFISLNDSNDDDNDVEAPPLKKRKLNQYIDDFNNGKIDDTKLANKLLKHLNKLQEKHEIHFYFTMTKEQKVEQDVDNDTDSDIDC